MRKYWRTVVEVEILSEDEPCWLEDLADIDYEIMEGDWSGVVKIKSQEEVSAKDIVDLLEAQGSESGFFQLDKNGNPVDD